MSKIFVWYVTVETEREELSFPVKISEGEKITDKEIRIYIKIYCKVSNVDIPWNFIYNLTFHAIDLNGNRYAESLSPRDFWHIQAMEYAAENRSMFRQDSKTKKGGGE